MRIKSAAINQGVSADKINEFSKLLSNIRDGYVPYLNNSRYLDDIQLPTVIAKNISEQELIDKLFPDINKNY